MRGDGVLKFKKKKKNLLERKKDEDRKEEKQYPTESIEKCFRVSRLGPIGPRKTEGGNPPSQALFSYIVNDMDYVYGGGTPQPPFPPGAGLSIPL